MTLAQLLVVQEHDSAIDRLIHQRTQLPEMAAIAQIDEEQAHLDAQRSELQEQRHVIEREQKRIEDEVAIVVDRHTSESERLYSGTVTAHKDLQLIQDELEVLSRRQAELEEQVLERMEAGEPLDQGLAELDAKLASVADRRMQASESLAASQAAIDSEVESERAKRAEAISPVAAELLSMYEAARVECGGVGASRLVDKTCEGCHLQLSAVDYDRIRKEPADAVIHHECGRILVR